jgi:hypothetical protein
MDTLGQEQNGQWLAEIAERIGQRKLALPLLLLLEVSKPFTFIASQGLLLCQPVLNFFYDEPTISRYADLLADRSSVEALIAQLELQGSALQPGGRGTDDST